MSEFPFFLFLFIKTFYRISFYRNNTITTQGNIHPIRHLCPGYYPTQRIKLKIYTQNCRKFCFINSGTKYYSFNIFKYGRKLCFRNHMCCGVFIYLRIFTLGITCTFVFLWEKRFLFFLFLFSETAVLSMNTDFYEIAVLWINTDFL